MLGLIFAPICLMTILIQQFKCALKGHMDICSWKAPSAYIAGPQKLKFFSVLKRDNDIYWNSKLIALFCIVRKP